jgi:hypothetical protein
VSGVRRNSVRQAANTSRDQASSSERYDGEPPSLQVAQLAGEHAKLSPSRQIDVFANHQSFDRMPPKKDPVAANDGDARCVQNMVLRKRNLVHNTSYRNSHGYSVQAVGVMVYTHYLMTAPLSSHSRMSCVKIVAFCRYESIFVFMVLQVLSRAEIKLRFGRL